MADRPDVRIIGYPGHEVLLPDVVRAENCSLYDSQGRRTVDLESGVWSTPLGHAHPRVVGVIARQAATIAHAGYCYSNPVVEESAREILDVLEFDGGACTFLCSGSEAVEYGVRTIRMITERPLLLTMTDSYFGAYGSAHRRGADEWFGLDWTNCASCARSGECDATCERWASIPFERIGGFLFEPGSSSGRVRFPPVKLIQNIVQRVREADGFILVNEVTTGLGRTGEWFGFQHYGFSPDAVALGKGLGNGYPVAVAAFSPRLAKRLGGRTPSYAQSHQNDPLGAAVALEVVRVLRSEHLIERGREIASLLRDGLARICQQTTMIREVRGRGLMIALEFHDDDTATFTRQLSRELLRRGYVVAQRPGLNIIRIDPALTIERTDIEGFLGALSGALTGT